MSKALEINNITVSYLQSRNGFDSMKDLFLKSSFKNPFNKYVVLRNFNLQINEGETVGIFGPNGCGKSTLLRTITGIVKPDKGNVKVHIPVFPLLNLGAGIETELTGYENIVISLVMNKNYDRNTKKEMIQKVAAFSELTDSDLSKPAKMYSTGMLARLSISSVMVINPKLLLIDEVLSVGDVGFRNKCKNRIYDFIQNDSTVIFVSHIQDEVLDVCKRGICIKDGQTIFDGKAEDAAKVYNDLF